MTIRRQAMDKKTRVTLQVAVDIPPGYNTNDMREYIREAIQTHRGGFDPQDGLFNANFDNVRISLVKKEITYG